MYFKDKLDSINTYICISVHTVSGNIARIAAILPELLQHCQKLICMRNPVLPQRCSNIAAKLPETVAAILPELICMRNPVLPQRCSNITGNCCCNIVAIYCQKACISIRVERTYNKGKRQTWFY